MMVRNYNLLKVWNSERIVFKDIHNLGFPYFHVLRL